MKVGLLGGSFDPPHRGHRHVADTARRALGLHRVIWLVSPKNPMKSSGPEPMGRRLEAVRRLAHPKDAVTDLEAGLGSAFTVDTLEWLRRRYPGVRFSFLMGSDNLAGFHRWRRWRRIPRLAQLVVVARPGSTVRGRLAPGGRHLRKAGARFVEAPLHADSSTGLRARAMAHLNRG